jgi:copper chaperone CopZ
VIKVKGMVCDFCARTVEKVFGEQEEVAAIRVDLDVQQIELDLKKDADLTDEAITKHIIDAGLNVVEIKRH